MMLETRARELSGAQALVAALELEDARHLFGVPGHGAYPIYDALNDFPTVAPVVGRNEQGALFAADGYARVTQDVAVATSVPLAGVTNSTTGIWEINGYGSRLLYLLEYDPLHEELLRPLVRHYRKAFSVADVAPAVHDLFRILRRGRPGVAVLEVPNGVLGSAEVVDPSEGQRGGGTAPLPERKLEEAASYLRRAERPVICAGGPGWDECSAAALTRIAHALRAPVLTGRASKGAVPEDDPLNLGFNYNLGGHAERLLAEADAVLAIGERAGMATGIRSAEVLAHQLIHLDWDGREQGAAFPARLALDGSVPSLLEALAARLPQRDRDAWPAEQLATIREASVTSAREIIPEAAPFFAALRAGLPRDAYLFTDSLAGLWAFRIIPAYQPNTVQFPWFTGTLGHGIPAAVGAALAKPDRPIAVLCGDGAFLYNSQELATMRYYGRKLIVVVANDNAYGAVRYNLKTRYGRSIAYELANPDFRQLARAYGMRARRLESHDQTEEAVREALATDASTLIEVPLSLNPPRQ